MHMSKTRGDVNLVWSFLSGCFVCFTSDVSSTGTREVGVTRVGSKPARQFERGSSKLPPLRLKAVYFLSGRHVRG